MKKSNKFFLLTISILFLFFSCKKNSLLVLSGEVKNSTSKKIDLYSMSDELIKTIHLNNDNTFIDTISLPEGYYDLIIEKKRLQVYIKPKFNLSIILDAKDIHNSIIYKGIGANENEYLFKKKLLNQELKKVTNYKYYAKLNESSFLKLMDSIYQLNKNLFSNHKKEFDRDFIFIESKSLLYKNLTIISSFENLHRLVSGKKDFKTSKNFPNPFDKINLNNEKLFISPDFFYFVESYIEKNAMRKAKKNSTDYYLSYANIIDSEIKSNKIKESLAYNIGSWSLGYTKELETFYTKIDEMLVNEKYKQEIRKSYDKIKRTQKGAISPSFELYDLNEKLISLESFRGKVVYIDIWATWCVPCIKEMPSLKKLEQDFKGSDIVFISISKSDTKEKWEKMIFEKKLSGVQLFAPDDNIPFFKDYSVNGLPRYILLDKEGKIINSNAKRPSDSTLKGQLESLL